MAVSKAIVKLTQGEVTDPALTYRERIKGYFRNRGKSPMLPKDREIWERCEAVQDILMNNRTDLAAAKKIIKEKYNLKHREEIDRYIEDARFLMGASFTTDKAYQRMIQHQDIEYWLQLAKTNGDGDLAEKMLLRREKLYQLDQPDIATEFNYFNVIVIKAEVKYFIDPADLQEAEQIKLKAMRELNMIEDLTDVEYTNAD